MVFSSMTFLMAFLPVCLILYYLTPNRGRNLVLFLCSLFFYAWGEPVYVVLMLFSTALDYTCGLMIEKYRGKSLSRLFLLLSVTVNLGMLATFKYSGMLAKAINHIPHVNVPVLHLALPIGISFYTFQTMSYSIDVYRNEVKAQHNIIDFGAFVTLFPQLIAGPIVRYASIADELKSRTHSWDMFGSGVRRFVIGLAKKVLLANNIGLLWEQVSAQTTMSTMSVWLGVIAYGFQIYFDFSGYSDMAIGLGSMFGFHFPENFDHPFEAANITDFWRRWHMTLGTWFRDYVYIPLGGNRKGMARQLFNIAIVWFLTGLWHGASWNFVLWGLYFGAVLLVEKLFLLRVLNRLPKLLQHLYTWVAVAFSWTLFACTKAGETKRLVKAMLGIGTTLWDRAAMYQMSNYALLLLVCLIASLSVGGRMVKGVQKRCGQKLLAVTDMIGIVCGMAFSLIFLVSGSYNPFLYFRF